MDRWDGPLRTVVTVLVALVVNVVLDVAFDLPLLARWSIALAAVLACVALIEVARRRSAAKRPEDSRS